MWRDGYTRTLGITRLTQVYLDLGLVWRIISFMSSNFHFISILQCSAWNVWPKLWPVSLRNSLYLYISLHVSLSLYLSIYLILCLSQLYQSSLLLRQVVSAGVGQKYENFDVFFQTLCSTAVRSRITVGPQQDHSRKPRDHWSESVLSVRTTHRPETVESGWCFTKASGLLFQITRPVYMHANQVILLLTVADDCKIKVLSIEFPISLDYCSWETAYIKIVLFASSCGELTSSITSNDVHSAILL